MTTTEAEELTPEAFADQQRMLETHILASDICEFLLDHVVFSSKHEATATTLWIMHTYVLDKIETTPRLAICAPEKQTGKTRLLECLNLLCFTPMLSHNASPAALVRVIDQLQPTVLLDEIDTIFGDGANGHEDTRSLINAGYRKGSTYIRCAGEKSEPRKYNAFCAVATAGIGTPPETIYDRAVIVNMRRKTKQEHVYPFRYALVVDRASNLCERLIEWAEAMPTMTNEDAPEIPINITDRQADIWEPLLWIANQAGFDWSESAFVACETMTEEQNTTDSDSSRSLRLLRDIRDVFDFAREPRLSTDDLLAGLYELEESEWNTSEYGQAVMDALRLSQLLKPYKIAPATLRFGKGVQKRGYRRSFFDDAWRRYLSDGDEGDA